MSDDKVVIKNLKVEVITKKMDNYNNEQVYFKILKGQENKFTVINKDGYHLPYFKTIDNKYLLKVKSKYVKLEDLNKDMTYICDLELKYYKMDTVEGYYVSKLA
jgi:regulatory protein YycI of two-component signal transduction system YycFG